MGYYAHHRRRNQCVWQPTDEDSDEFCKTEVEPMLRDVPAMRSVFPAVDTKSRLNTLREKIGIGMQLHLRGGKAAKNYRRLTLHAAWLDETDGFDPDIEHEGSPIALAAKRTEAEEKIKQHEPLIRHQMVMLFSAQTSETINAPDGRENLRVEALKQVQDAINGEEGKPIVEDLLFNNLIIQ